MIRFLAASLGLHVAGVALIAGAARAPVDQPPSPIELELLEVAGGGASAVSSSTPDELAGGATVKAKTVRRRELKRGPAPSVDGLLQQLDAGALVDPEDVGAAAVDQVPLGGGAGELGTGELARGPSRALIQRRVQEVADLMTGGRRLRLERVVISIDGRGYVVNHEHAGELDKILHLAEPFPAGGPYVVTVEY